MTRFGEFFLLDDFSLCPVFSKITKVDKNFGDLFNTVKFFELILKKWIGIHFGRFFANAQLVTLILVLCLKFYLGQKELSQGCVSGHFSWDADEGQGCDSVRLHDNSLHEGGAGPIFKAGQPVPPNHG
jgi:hypothetical protein